MKFKVISKFISRWGLLIIVFTAAVNHLITFFAYEWYPGMDSYSYDICGLQLVTGKVFDLFPVMFRPPFVPIVKNILYLLFEGHQYALCLLLHLIGILTVVLAYLLGAKFHKVIGFIIGMLMATNLQISVLFHSISTFTFYVPLLLLTANCFVSWAKNPDVWLLSILVLSVFLCILTRSETIILIPAFWIFGGLSHRNWRQAFIYLILTFALYNFVCFIYYSKFGYWGITYKVGRSLFNRVTRGRDCLFDIHDGPASGKVYEFMSKWIPVDVSPEELGERRLLVYTENEEAHQEYLGKIGIMNVPLIYRQMYTLNMAQKELGLIKADDILRDAALEAICARPWEFTRWTFIRMLAQLGLIRPRNLGHGEYLLQRAKFLYNTVDNPLDLDKVKEDKHWYHPSWFPPPYDVASPFSWEKKVLKVRILRLFGKKIKEPELPESFQIRPNIKFESGQMEPLYLAGHGALTERLWNCCDLDVFFSLIYWGPRWQSETALRLLKYWDMLFMPEGKTKLILEWIIWLFWIMGVLFAFERWQSMTLSAFMVIVLFQALCQAVFSDNFGGRFTLYMLTFHWLGGVCGFWTLYRRWFTKLIPTHY